MRAGRSAVHFWRPEIRFVTSSRGRSKIRGYRSLEAPTSPDRVFAHANAASLRSYGAITAIGSVGRQQCGVGLTPEPKIHISRSDQKPN
jgi:hypothetical protein